MAALSPRQPTFPLSVIVLSGALVLALLAFTIGDGPPEAKAKPEIRPATFGGLVSRPIGVTGPATLGARLHAVPPLPAQD